MVTELELENNNTRPLETTMPSPATPCTLVGEHTKLETPVRSLTNRSLPTCSVQPTISSNPRQQQCLGSDWRRSDHASIQGQGQQPPAILSHRQSGVFRPDQLLRNNSLFLLVVLTPCWATSLLVLLSSNTSQITIGPERSTAPSICFRDTDDDHQSSNSAAIHPSEPQGKVQLREGAC